MQKIFILLLLISFQGLGQSMEVLLYPDGAPGAIAGHGLKEADVSERDDGVIRLRNITDPSLTIYQAKKNKSKGAAVVICPGGGYHILAINKEGYKIGEWFAERGITAFVLKSRLPQPEMFTEKQIRPLEDAQAAIKYVRENASKYGVNPEMIGIMGFSAGGHLAATASTHFDKGVGVNENSEVSLRPDFSILMYPVISFSDKLAHTGSRMNLIGPELKIEEMEHFSNELQVTPNTPPAFLVHAYDDGVVMENSLAYIKALRQFKIPAELHLYEKGGHGFGLAYDQNNPVSTWSDRLEDWLKNNELLK
ncbi:alpha/beta hydrolase [Arcticibacterium luteifluviistationis]|uniref:Alpha/beta hydrolase n=1 Tax=Arcticibacterium luteifluviistationis TaxID=1784714 RepID=A0A2Z4GDA3_9BACT|nr:alpha/beta hydrolase [Arcticibacterium luteifluviistationis]AWV99005.1 alpha/beta hydrolase [Arcticibacterium luteifluviistationis]